MTQITLSSPAKLNLFLHINSRRADGYHNIQTLFHLIDYCDELIFQEHSELKVTCNNQFLRQENNLVFQAAALLRNTAECQQGVLININKKIPIGAGLGGGSSNAATTLHGLNKFWRLNFTENQLVSLGKKLGADVPVFVKARSSFAERTGDRLTPIILPNWWYLVVYPNCHVSTADMFQNKDLKRNNETITLPYQIQPNQILSWLKKTDNNFQPLVKKLYPLVHSALVELKKISHLCIRDGILSGSGACVFATFETEFLAKKAQSLVSNQFYTFLCQGVNSSILKKELEQK